MEEEFEGLTLEQLEGEEDDLESTEEKDTKVTPETPTNNEEPEFDGLTLEEIDPELARMQKEGKINLTNYTPMTQEQEKALDDKILGVDVTEQIKAGQALDDSLAYDNLYKDAFTAENFEVEAAKVFDETLGVMEDGKKIHYRFSPSGEVEKIIVPEPSSTQGGRIIGQAFRDIYQNLGGLLTEGAITSDSKFELERPDLEMTGGEQFLTDLLAIGAPSIPIIKGAKYVGKLGKGVATGKKGAELGLLGTMTADAFGASVVESIMSGDVDEGLVIKPGLLSSQFPNLSDEAAKDISMFIDGMFLNGVFDGIVSIAGVIGGKAKELTQGLRKAAAKQEALREAVTGETVSNVLKYLDPELENLSPKQFKMRVKILAEKLNENSTIDLVLGSTQREINLDSSQAMLKSTEAYIKEINQNLLNEMSEEEFNAFAAQKAAEMSSRMISLLKSQSSNEMVRNTNQSAADQIGKVISTEADANVIAAGSTSVDAAAQDAGETLVGMQQRDVSDLDLSNRELNAQTDELLSAQKTVLQDNPIINDLVGGDTNTFASSAFETRQEVQSIIEDKAFKGFVDDMTAVDTAYKTLPAAPIDAALLKSKLDSVVQAANDFDDSGSNAATVLRDIFEGFAPKRTGTATDAMPIVGESPTKAIMETPEQVIERIGETITFSDLYDVKAKLASVIDSYRDKPRIQQRLIEFRNHITDADNGQMAFVIANAPPEVSKSFSDADTLFKTAKSKYANSEPVRRLEQVFSAAKPFVDQPYPGPLNRNAPDVTLTSSQFIDEAVADQTGTLINQLEYMVSDAVGAPEVRETMKDMFIADMVDTLRTAMIKGDINDPEAVLLNAFRPIQDKMKTLGDTEFEGRIIEAYREVRDAFGALGDMSLANADLLAKNEARRQQLENKVLTQLISTVPGRSLSGIDGQMMALQTRSDAREVFRGIIEGPDSANKLKELLSDIDRVENNPSALTGRPGGPKEANVARAALQSVALETIGQKVFGTTPTGLVSGNEATKNITTGTVGKLTSDEATNLMKSIDVLYGDDVGMSEALTGLLSELYEVSIPSRLKSSQAGSDTASLLASDTNIRDAVSTTILLTAGYMNPTAAMLRRLTSVPIAEREKLVKDISANVLAVIVSDPKTFSSMINRAVDGYQAGFDLQTLSDGIMAASKFAISSTARTGRYEVRVVEDEDYGAIDKDIADIWQSSFSK